MTNAEPTNFFYVKLPSGSYLDHEELPAPPVEAYPFGGLARAQDAQAVYPESTLEPVEAPHASVPTEVLLTGPFIPFAQYEVCRGLAHRFEHNWGVACTLDVPHGNDVPMLRAARRELLKLANNRLEVPLGLIALASDALGYGSEGGIRMPVLETVNDEQIVVHATGTGRTRWYVRPNGDARLEVWRPNAALVALNAEGEEAGEVVGMMRPALELMLGRRLDYYQARAEAKRVLEAAPQRLVLLASVTAKKQHVTACQDYEVRHVAALEEALRGVWVDKAFGLSITEEWLRTTLGPLYRECPDYEEWVRNCEAEWKKGEAVCGQGFPVTEWPWAAGEPPALAA